MRTHKIAVITTAILVFLGFFIFFENAKAQVVPAQNQIIPSAYFGQGYLISTSTSPTHKLGANLIDLAGSYITGILPVIHGGTGSSTLSGILVGDGTNPIKTLLIGSGLSFDGSTLSATGGGGGSGTVGTSSSETATYIPFWTSTNGTPALLSGGVSGFTWDNTLGRLFATKASSTLISVSATGAATTTIQGSATASSTFAGPIVLSNNSHIVAHGIQGDGSDGLHIDSSASGPVVALFGAGGGQGTTFYGGVNIDGATRLATSLSGFLKATSGTVSAVSSLVPSDFSLTKGNFLVGDDAGVAQATSSIFVSSTGQVGIGTTSPLYPLHVSGSGDTIPMFESTSATGDVGIRLKNGDRTWLFYNNAPTDDFTIRDDTSGINAFVIQAATGRVGLGTTSPAAPLDIVSATVPTIRVGTNATDATNKFGYVASRHYTNSEEDVMMFMAGSSNTENSLRLGGGSGVLNAVNRISFITGATQTTLDGTERMRIDSAGNVGIGTSSPGYALTVQSSASNVADFVGPNAGFITVRRPSYTAGTGLQLGVDSANLAWVGSNSNINLALQTNSTERLRITTAGNVGIGTTSPYAKLSVVGEVVGANFTATSTTATSTFAGGLAVETSGLVYDLSTNRVGIGTASPSSALTINGGVGSLATGLTFGDGDTGIYENADDDLYVDQAGATVAALTPTVWRSATTRAWYLKNAAGAVGSPSYSFVGDNNTGFYSPSADNVRLSIGGTDAWTVDSSRMFGIGTTSPFTNLSVAGSAYIGGNLTATGTLTVSGTGTSTFSGGIDGTTMKLSGLLDGVSAFFTTLLRIPYSASPTVATNGDIGIDSTSNQFKFFSGGAERVLGDGNFYPAFTYATTTAWAGTTTVPLGPAYTGETWNGVKCFTDTGTVNVSFYDGTNRMNMFNASTTVGTVALTSNNTFTASEKRYVDIGTPASSPTKVSCTVSKSITAD